MRGSVKSPAGFQLRIALRDVLPPTWRRFVVPCTITLPSLHRVIQEVDGWEHDLVLERIVTGSVVTDAVCLEGERSCPPEDVGGPSGYIDYLEAFRDPSHPDHREMVEWRGSSFDPERFDIVRINQRLNRFSRSK